MNIYFMRHGETEWNKEQRIQGSTDIPLNQNGIDLAQKTSDLLYQNNISFDLIYTSPLIRAAKTAEIMNCHSGARIIHEERIKEFVFGEAEGITYTELRTNPKFCNLKNWFLNPIEYKDELGAESFNHFFSRIESFLESLKELEKEQQSIAQENQIKNILIVCHGGVVRGLLKVMTNCSVQECAKTKIPNCGINLATLNNGNFKIEYTARIFSEI